MNPPPTLKLLFDENFGRPLVQALAGLLAFHPDKPEVKHVLDFYAAGESDDVWIPQIAKGGWIVVSGDRAKQYGGPKLPLVCAACGVTHVLIGGALHHWKQFDKARAVLAVWPDLALLPAAPPGTRYDLRLTPTLNPTLVPHKPGPKRPPPPYGPPAPPAG